jgi:hypothetical protein
MTGRAQSTSCTVQSMEGSQQPMKTGLIRAEADRKLRSVYSTPHGSTIRRPNSSAIKNPSHGRVQQVQSFRRVLQRLGSADFIRYCQMLEGSWVASTLCGAGRGIPGYCHGANSYGCRLGDALLVPSTSNRASRLLILVSCSPNTMLPRRSYVMFSSDMLAIYRIPWLLTLTCAPS